MNLDPIKAFNAKYPGRLFVVEGGDGTGKKTQTDLLVERLKREGYRVAIADFPRYGEPSQGHPASYGVRKYLIKPEFGFVKGYGPASDINPYAASLWFALDRFDAAFCQENRPNLWDLLWDDYIVVSNRYTESNIGFQASKIEDPTERREFVRWLMDLEYNKMQIPRPDLVILLDLEPEIAMEIKRRQREQQGLSMDAHEEDSRTYERSRRVYLETAEMFPETWRVVKVGDKLNTTKDLLAGVHSRQVVHNMIWAEVIKFLSRK